ncbi:hypothetical protein DFH11DRAFT_817171 [Phellopilus nigrolimitatus]|nr:hypothetical protein DFH11DRAFT_817171 [Phellopilus nigrolimitatus]
MANLLVEVFNLHRQSFVHVADMSETGSLAAQDQIDLLHNINIVRYAAVVALALVVYDYLITLSDEKRLIWPSRLNAVKIVFLLNRYLPLIALPGLVLGE